MPDPLQFEHAHLLKQQFSILGASILPRLSCNCTAEGTVITLPVEVNDTGRVQVMPVECRRCGRFYKVKGFNTGPDGELLFSIDFTGATREADPRKVFQ